MLSSGDSWVITLDIPVFISVHGWVRQGGRAVADDATLSVTFRQVSPFSGSSGFVCTINGEAVEMQVTSPAGPFFQSDPYSEAFVIKLRDHRTSLVQVVEWD